jgi:YidC/Oxa1 family membrane protein insertase
MSKPQGPQKPNLINILLIAVMVYLGYMVFTEPQRRAGQEKRTAGEILTELKDQNKKLLDVTAPKTAQAYRAQLGDLKKSLNLTQEEVDRLDMQALMLQVDTSYKSAMYREKLGGQDAHLAYGKLGRGLDALKTKFESDHTKPIWDEKFEVAPAPDLGLVATQVSPSEMYVTLVTLCSEKAKTEPVMGFIPGYQVIDSLVKLTGSNPYISYWLAAFLLALAVRILVFPLAQKQYIWGRQMARLGPYTKEIKERFTDKKTGQITDQAGFQQETMKLYKEYGMNPFSGCGPAMIQIPLFLTVYQCMQHYKFEFTKGYFLWMNPHAGKFLGLPLAPNLGERDYIMVILYGISMIVSTLLQPVSDPSNARQGRLMGLGMALLFSVMMFFWPLPSAFVVYWTFTNILSTTQALIAYRLPLPPLEKKQTVKGGALPFDRLLSPPGTDPNGIGKTDSSFFSSRGTPKQNKKKKKK